MPVHAAVELWLHGLFAFMRATSWPRRAAVRGRDRMTPGDELGGAIVAIDSAFDQCRAVLMRERRLDRG
jgi:hypothetical protein